MTICIYVLTSIRSFSMLVHKQLTVSNSFCSVCAAVVQLQVIFTIHGWLLYLITIIVTLIYVSTCACTLHVSFCCWEPFVYILHPLCNQTESYILLDVCVVIMKQNFNRSGTSAVY